MSTLSGFSKLVFCSSDHDFVTMVHEVMNDTFQIQLLWSSFYQRNVIDTERGLKRSIFVKHVQNYVRNCIVFKFVNDSETLSVGLVTDFVDSRNLLILHQFSSSCNHFCFVDLVRNFGYDDRVTVSDFFEIYFCTQNDTAFSGVEGIAHSVVTVNNSAGWEIGGDDVLHELINRNFVIINIRYNRINTLGKVMRRHIRSHTHSNTRCAINQKIRDFSRHYGRLRQRIIKVILEVYGFFI